MKNGIAAPEIKSVDNFDTAIPSSLFDENVNISKALIIPCSVPPAASNIISAAEREVSLNTGSRTTVTRKATAEGIHNLAAR